MQTDMPEWLQKCLSCVHAYYRQDDMLIRFIVDVEKADVITRTYSQRGAEIKED